MTWWERERKRDRINIQKGTETYIKYKQRKNDRKERRQREDEEEIERGR